MLGPGLGSLDGGGWRIARAAVTIAAIEGLVCAYGIGSLALFARVGEFTGPTVGCGKVAHALGQSPVVGDVARVDDRGKRVVARGRIRGPGLRAGERARAAARAMLRSGAVGLPRACLPGRRCRRAVGMGAGVARRGVTKVGQALGFETAACHAVED